jgi:hypothetical protein
VKRLLIRIIFGTTLTALALCAALFAFLWFRGSTVEPCMRTRAAVFEDGKELKDAHVFRGTKREVLLIIPSRSPSAAEIYWPEDNEVGTCNTETLLDLGVVGFQKHDRGRNGTYPCAGAGKQEITQNVQAKDSSLAYNHYDGSANPSVVRRIEIRW